ncbi:MAG: glycoside hydrolase family 99-like domain-containing protein [Bacteroidales bacterium]|nr:glycoside hydrolase family 99-like domain-containing protein [Bacteroidales bacterium]
MSRHTIKRLSRLLAAVFVVTAFFGCDDPENTAPVIIGVVPGMETANVGTTHTFTCVAEDDNPSELAYQWQSSCGGIQGDTTGQAITWKAPLTAGECTLTVTLSDGEFSDEHAFTVTVRDPNETGDVTVGVYYYPWYGGSNFHGRQYLREHLVPVQLPELGEYNDRDAEVIAQQLEWCEYAGISLWVSSWWGPGKMEDVTLLDHILVHPELGDMKIALFYETSGRIPDFTDLSRVTGDIQYIADNYFDHPNYYKIDGRPVLFVYLTRVLSNKGLLDETMDLMRAAANSSGYDIYIVGDQVFGQPPSFADQLALLDAATNYDVYGSSGARMYATQKQVDNYYTAQAGWKSKAQAVGTAFIPATAPGFNDTGVRDGHVPLSRKLSGSNEFGSLFRAMVEKAVTMVDPASNNLFLVTSWNEWHEDTQIEPVAVAPATSVDDSGTQEAYTYGMEYEGYGTRYLDILREAVGK